MRKNTKILNCLLLGICVALAALFIGFLAFDTKTEAVRNQKLTQEAKKTNEKEKVKDETAQKAKKEQTEEEETPERQTPTGISFWGDEFFAKENELQYLLWSSIFVTLMANKIGGLQFGIYRNCQISSRVFHTAVAALPLTKANRSDFE